MFLYKTRIGPQAYSRLLGASARPKSHSFSSCSLLARATPQEGLHNRGPLDGLKVLDLSRVLAGPFCTQILADYGADVIKVEQPGSGDEPRSWQTAAEKGRWKVESLSMYFSAINRNKRSITMNFKNPEARQIFYRLVEDVDVLVENFIPGKADELEIGYDKLSEINPRLVYASISGYGNTGPYGKRAGYDAVAGAEAGLMHVTGHPDSEPVRPGLGMTDMSTGYLAHGAILAALYSRQSTGRGQYISTSLFETQLSMLINVGALWLNTGVEGQRWGAAHPSVVPYNAYQAKDGAWFQMGGNTDRQFRILCERLSITEVSPDDPEYATNAERVKRREKVDGSVRRAVGRMTAEEVDGALTGSGLAYGRINTIGGALSHPQAGARDMVQSVSCDVWDAPDGNLKLIGPAAKFSDTPANIRARAPFLGEHTVDILGELGVSAEEVERLRKDKAL